MALIKCLYLCLLFSFMFVNANAFNPVGNIIMSSINFFHPLLRIVKSFYSIEKSSSSKNRFMIANLEYRHLQTASNGEIECSIKSVKRRSVNNKLIFFAEEKLNTTQKTKSYFNATNQLRINSIQNLTNETRISEYSASNISMY